MFRAITSACVLAALLLTSPIDAGPKEDARRLNEEGTGLLKAERHLEARQRFEEAYTQFQHDVIALNVALASLHLGEYQEAFHWLWMCEKGGVEPKLRTKWQKIHDVAMGELSTSHGIVTLTGLPRGALVLVDGAKQDRLSPAQPRAWLLAGAHSVVVIAGGRHAQIDVEVRPGVSGSYEVRFEGGLAGTLLVEGAAPGTLVFVDDRNYGEIRPEGFQLSPGAYTLRLESAGHEDQELRVSIRSGARATVQATLTPRVDAARGGRPGPGDASGVPGTWSWVTMGAGAALLVGGGIVHGMIAAAAGDLDADLRAGRIDADRYEDDWASEVSGRAPLMYGLYATGGVALATGATLWLTGVEGFSSRGAMLTPLIAPRGGGLVLTLPLR
jgi:hypothetical protein